MQNGKMQNSQNANDETPLCLTIQLVLYINVMFPTICNPNLNFSEFVD